MAIAKTPRLAPRLRFPFGVRGFVFSIMIAGLAAAMITAYTGAVFTDTVTSSGNYFTAGTVMINLDDSRTPVAYLELPKMAPGDGYVADIKVQNKGSLALKYALSVAPIAINAIDASVSGQTTIHTVADDGLIVGDFVTIAGASQSTLNDTFEIVSVEPLSFTIALDSILVVGAPVETTAVGTLATKLEYELWLRATACGATDEAESVNTAKGLSGTTVITGSYLALPLTGSVPIKNYTDGSIVGAESGFEHLCVKVILPSAVDSAYGDTPLTTPKGFQNVTSGYLGFQVAAKQAANP